MTDLDLRARAGLPDALRSLMDDYPRDAWETHPNFTGLVQFWLERHIMFRQLGEMMDKDARDVLDRQMDGPVYARRLGRFGGMLVQQLHGHHQIEDLHYFPALQGLEPRLGRGFEMLEKDHEALDGILAEFGQAANGAIRATSPELGAGSGHAGEGAGPSDRKAAADFRETLIGFRALLDRHLEDEEDLIVPVILAADPGALD